MAMKKRFYSVNGQMMGYESSGVKKDFLTDHLGSITAEIDQTQTRTYDTRYSAYGRNNWSTGTGCGFGWVGSYGYRETGLFHMSHYIRARHYSYITGNWSTVDPLWPSESAYGYVGGSPTSQIDASGASPVRVLTDGILYDGCCGVYSAQISMFTNAKRGWIVQEIAITSGAFKCGGEWIPTGCGPSASIMKTIYYEAIPVGGFSGIPKFKGLDYLVADRWSEEADLSECTYGTWLVEAKTMWVEKLPAGFTDGAVKCAGSFKSSRKFSGFKNNTGDSRSLRVNWGCCARGIPCAPGPDPDPECPCPSPKVCSTGACSKQSIILQPSGWIR